MKRTKEQYIPRFNNITITCDRVGEAKVYDANSNVSEYQTVINVGEHIKDLKAGDKVKIEKSVFPELDIHVDPDFEDKIKEYSKEIEDKINKIRNLKTNKKKKDSLLQDLQEEYTGRVQEINTSVKIPELPIYKDEVGDEFIWCSDRAIIFKFA